MDYWRTYWKLELKNLLIFVVPALLVGMVVGLTGAFAGDWAIVSMYILFIVVVTFRARGLAGKKSVLDV